MNTYKYFLGNDIGKSTVAVCVIHAQEKRLLELSIPNTSEGMQTLLDKLQTLPEFSLQTTLFCMEHTAAADRRRLLPADGQFFLCLRGGSVAPVSRPHQA